MDTLDILSNRKALLEKETNLMLTCYAGENLEGMIALVDKIHHMCLNIGCPISVKPMLKSIISGKIKMWTYYNRTSFEKMSERGHQLHGYNTGRIHRTWKKGEDYVQGHFRWNHIAYMMTRSDRDFLENFFFKGIRETGNNTVAGIQMRGMQGHVVSDNLFRLLIYDIRGNEYAAYYYVDDEKMVLNWRKQPVEGEEKEKILNLMKSQMPSLQYKITDRKRKLKYEQERKEQNGKTSKQKQTS